MLAFGRRGHPGISLRKLREFEPLRQESDQLSGIFSPPKILQAKSLAVYMKSDSSPIRVIEVTFWVLSLKNRQSKSIPGK